MSDYYTHGQRAHHEREAFRQQERESAARWRELSDLWDELQDYHQREIIETARVMLAPVPQSLRA